MEECAGDDGVEVLSGRIQTRAWGNSRPVVWAHGEGAGAANRRVELYLQHGNFEVPKRLPLGAYARRPGASAPSENAETEAQAVKNATFDADEGFEDEADWGYNVRQQVMVQLPDGRQVVMPLNLLHQLQMMDQDDAMVVLTQLLETQRRDDDEGAEDDQQSDEEDNEDDQDSPSVDIAEHPPPEPLPQPETDLD